MSWNALLQSHGWRTDSYDPRPHYGNHGNHGSLGKLAPSLLQNGTLPDWFTSPWVCGVLTPQSRRSSPSCCSPGSGRLRPASRPAAPPPASGSRLLRTSSSRRSEADSPLPRRLCSHRNTQWERRAANMAASSRGRHSLGGGVVLYAEPVVDSFLPDSFMVQPAGGEERLITEV